VMSPCERILARLGEVGFQVHSGPIAPFEEKLPLVLGTAWDTTTAQLALVVEMDETPELDVWRQLMFAGAALRHHLAADGPAALGTPQVLAIVDEEGERTVRTLVEDLNQHYAVFTRVDLNLIRREEIGDDEALDDALAPLLPRCREAHGEEISKKEVLQFWGVLRDRVQATAEQLDDMFAGFRKAAGKVAADALIGDLGESPDLPSPSPLETLTLKRFRSFEGQEVNLAPVTVVHGMNGSGKSALLEAMELCWARTSQRKPWDVEPSEYGRHLPRDGEGEFEVVGDGPPVTAVAERPAAELGRCVLTQDTVSRLVNLPPKDRYAQLLETTGLELPEIGQKTETLLRDAKREIDEALREAGLPPLKTAGSDGVKHLNTELRGSIAARLPPREDIIGMEGVLAKASKGAYSPRVWKREKGLVDTIDVVDGVLATAPLDAELDVSSLDAAAEAVKAAASSRRDHAQAMRLLLDAIRSAQRDQGHREQAPEEQLVPPVPRGLAVRWLSHSRALGESAKSFRKEGGEIETPEWSERLRAYADSLEAVAAEVPEQELEAFAGADVSAAPAEEVDIPEERYRAAGFSGRVASPVEVLPTIEEYVDLLQRQTAEFDSIVTRLEKHPAREFAVHSELVLGAMCKYELARRLRRKGPIAKASEEVVGDLLEGRLAPVVRELLAALVRFEWYFKPPKISGKDREIVIGGIATEREDLDARLMLNAAERSVVGLAWFLALHLLQPRERRRVLVIDDASAAFDTTNQAAFIATLRAFVRLARPEQLIVVSHDDAVAESLAEELAPVGDWPAAVARIRCERNRKDVSVVRTEQLDESPRDLESDLERLGLMDEMQAPA
jgi:energy-coupling factor transporter ATP-binding protein EcfA2